MLMQKTLDQNRMMIPIDDLSLLDHSTLNERFIIRHAPQINERAYHIITIDKGTVNVVEFGLSPDNKRLARCTCEDFTFNGGKICKHMKAATPLHRGRMRLKADKEKLLAGNPHLN